MFSLKQELEHLFKKILRTYSLGSSSISSNLHPTLQHYSRRLNQIRIGMKNKEDYFFTIAFIWIFCLWHSVSISYQVYLTSTGGKTRHQIFPSWKPMWVASLHFSSFYKRVPLCSGMRPHIAVGDILSPSLTRHSRVYSTSLYSTGLRLTSR